MIAAASTKTLEEVWKITNSRTSQIVRVVGEHIEP